MGATSKIEWTEATWNPIRARNIRTGKVGWHCEHATTGCEHCYAEAINKRLGTGLPFKPGHLQAGDIELFLDEAMLLAPLRWKKPRKIFVGSMTDLFASFVADAWLDRIFAVMALCPQHTFQVLTKRSMRMREYLSREDLPNRLAWEVTAKVMNAWRPGWKSEAVDGPYRSRAIAAFAKWPLPNLWLGVSAERQEEADERIPLLLQTPAAVRFLSAEPLLGPIDLTHTCMPGYSTTMSANLDWVIVGGESGSNARPMHPDWARSLRDQCAAAGVPFFFKQMTKKGPIPDDLMVREFPPPPCLGANP